VTGLQVEKKLVDYISYTTFKDIPREPLDIVKRMVVTGFGNIIAGATAEGCEDAVELFKEIGGKEEATILVHGGKIPAQNAAFVNSVMARALDYCDAMAPGVHVGSTAVPSALAAAELAGGCSGRDFLTALVLGIEISSRLNLSESAYDGFDPTGVCSVFASAVIASRLLHLNPTQTWNALGLAFNRSGGSFQSNIDGTLAVRIGQGFTSQNGILCARLASRNITGPENFLGGIYGYFHLFGKDECDPEFVTGELGERFELTKTMFKKYPSCGATLSATDVILSLARENNLVPEDIARIDVKLPPYTYKLVGHQFEIGNNPKVNAQFNVQYCIANALLRKGSKLSHFEESRIRDPRIIGLINKIHVASDHALAERHHTAVDIRVLTKKGSTYNKSLDIAPGFPGNPLNEEDYKERFQDCLSYSSQALPAENVERLSSMVASLEETENVLVLVPLLLS
jgi:2-methylcitrate dehydratase PrpD